MGTRVIPKLLLFFLTLHACSSKLETSIKLDPKKKSVSC